MKRFYLLLTTMLMIAPAQSELQVVELYSQDALLQMIRDNTHLMQMRRDDCQLVEDVQAHAKILKEPAYQMLWADMLMYGVCIEKNVKEGFYYLETASESGLPDALEQLGRYYRIGKFTLVNEELAVHYYKLASEQGHLRARFDLVRMYIRGYGAPRDYPQAYRWLFEEVYEHDEDQATADELLSQLARFIPRREVETIEASQKFQDKYR
ncbi:Sel1 repeat-containing protein [Ferrimonas sediminum]|uniref:Sel1 repeat-containing protein n=1 Tax=Ferrimonas sediminum TaxID=718193 RepID=A0A1G8ML24_9GAMM|nr:tetratricopeptide repeat protein [Ferrimonas sediminum]SDI68546.1 Sel1 repeat-containing protein [Ferrimonas sediminum]